MTAKDYIKIADILRKIENVGVRDMAASEFATMLKNDNPRFDRARFMAACGVPE